MSVSETTLRKLAEAKEARTIQLLFKAARILNEEAMARVNRQAGRPVLRQAHTALFPHIDFQGTRITDIARKVGVTKQAVGQLLDEMETAGVVERLVDPTDKRARLVRFTERGAEAMLHGLGVLRDLERDLEKAVGKSTMRELHEALVKVLKAAPQGDK